MQSYLVWILPDPADVESVVLEETPKQASRPPAGVQQAWEQQAQQPMWLFIFIAVYIFIYCLNLPFLNYVKSQSLFTLPVWVQTWCTQFI